MSDLIIFLTLVIIGFSVGTFNERRHLTSLRRREAKSLDLPTISSDELDPTRLVQECTLVVGSVVIATDYFKVVAASIANFFGRRVSAYETLLDRARRESLLRMKDQAEGYDIIIHTRLESCSIGGEAAGRNSAKSVECFAYGTAVRYAPVEG